MTESPAETNIKLLKPDEPRTARRTIPEQLVLDLVEEWTSSREESLPGAFDFVG